MIWWADKHQPPDGREFVPHQCEKPHHKGVKGENMREKEVEKYLIRAVRKTGGLCLKFISPGWSGAPDRICLWPGGRIAFVEVKRPGERLRPLQERRAEELRELGFNVCVVDSLQKAREVAGV